MRIFFFLLTVSFTFPNTSESAESGRLLNCERYNGEQEFHIFINEAEGFVIYNAQPSGTDKRILSGVPVSNSDETTIVDLGIDITTNNSAFIIASNETSTLLISKADSSFAYAWVSPIPVGDEIFTAFGNHHEGKCSSNPFD